MLFKPHKYQAKATKFILDKTHCGLFLDMGLGKTSSTLTAIVDLMDMIEIRKPLIIAPKLVAEQTWLEEITKWDHTRHLKLSRMIGSEKNRVKALMAPADIYIISRDNIAWLIEYLLKLPNKKWPFDMIVIDELSSFKNSQSRRFKSLRKAAGLAHRIVGLTGTPAPNSLMDLWAPMYLLDKGERLGRTITRYREDYFIKNYNGFGYDIRQGAAEMIHNAVKDICISMTAEDYLSLPERIDIVKNVHLKDYAAYKDFMDTEMMFLPNGDDITPLNAAAMYNKLLQFANGAVYDDVKNYHIVDMAKMEALEEAVEELNGEPAIIFYSFKSDLERMQVKFKQGVVLQGTQQIDDWNAGKIPLLFAHPASTGHGLNLQGGGSVMMWYGVPWSLELYQQTVKRLDRQGQKKAVRNIHFIAHGTVDEIVLSRLHEKDFRQKSLITALKAHLK